MVFTNQSMALVGRRGPGLTAKRDRILRGALRLLSTGSGGRVEPVYTVRQSGHPHALTPVSMDYSSPTGQFNDNASVKYSSA